MKTKLKVMIASVLVAAGIVVTAGAASYESSADKLKDLGLFQGTGSGYELDRAPTRGEAAGMLVRLLGKEAEAKELTYSAPFTDLADWQKPYVQYLYDNKLANGITDTTFEPGKPCSAQMYTTFLLRALGYSDATGGDFTYADAINYGQKIGLVDFANYDANKFLRDHVAAMTLTALNTDVKGESEKSLLEKLVADGAVEKAKADKLLDFFSAYNKYAEVASSMSEQAKMDVDVDINGSVKMDNQNFMTISMPMNLKMDMDIKHMDQAKMAMTGNMKMTLDKTLVGPGEQNSIDQPVEYYYTDGVYYINVAGQKIKMDLGFEDMMAQVEQLSSVSNSQPICLIDSITQSGETMTVNYSAAGMTGFVKSVLGSMNILPEADGAPSISIGNVTYKLGMSNGKLSTMDLTMQISVKVEQQTMVMDFGAKYKVNALGDGVKITMPSDLNTYVDIASGAEPVMGMPLAELAQ